MPRRVRAIAGALLVLALVAPAAPVAQSSATRITTPQQFFGHDIGADHVLPNYTAFAAYLRILDEQSDRLQVHGIGRTAEGRDQLMAIVTAAENFRALARYRDISRRLSLAEDLSDDQARALAQEGKAVVWIDGGLHATEVLGPQQLIETIVQFVSRNDEETLRILRDVIILFVHANPDGMELVSDWYMRNPDPTLRRTSGIPRLYQKYIGHDNNRDFYSMNQPESTNMNRVLYREWFPQIMYNHHQTGPAGTVMFSPPFRDPFNYAFDPLVINTLDQVGAAMHARFAAEGKPGVTTRSGANYSTWWNGGLRTTAYFHNQVGLLTESIGNPTPVDIPFIPDRQLPKGDYPFPIAPQRWHFRSSVDYSVTANRAVLDFAQRHRETLLFNIYVMGRNAIRRGQTDTWTTYPRYVAEIKAAAAKEPPAPGGRGGQAVATKYYDALRKPEWRDPRGYIIPAGQPDFLTATKFVNALIKAGVTVERATASFQVGGTSYPAGSFVVRTAQAFRPHVLDMFEPQDHPNDLAYPGGPPLAPYDTAGWTLAFQMGVKFDRVLEAFDAPTTRLSDIVRPARGVVNETANAVGYVTSHAVNDAALAVNRLLDAGEEVYWVEDRTWQSPDGAGVIFIAAKPSTSSILERAAADLGLTFTGVTARPAGGMMKLHPVRIGLWDQYGGSMPSGHVRWLLEQFEFPYEVVYPATLDAGNLRASYDLLLFPDGGIPASDEGGAQQPRAEDIPEEYRSRLGRVTLKTTIPALRRFVEEGGTLVAWGGSANVGRHLGLPVDNHLVEVQPDGTRRPLATTRYYVPGSIVRVAVDNTNPLAFGLERQVDVFFNNSPVMAIKPDASLRGLRPIAWFDSAAPLRSGWALGQHHLDGGAAAVEASIGLGKVVLFGPEITFRAQPHGTFKFLFNSIYSAAVQTMSADGLTPAPRSGRMTSD